MKTSLRRKFFGNPFVLTIIAIVLGFVVASLILLLAGFPPKESIETLVQSMIGRPKDIASVVIRSTPIIFTGLGVAFAIKTGLFNIGAEGQYVMGCVVATMVGSMLDFPKPVAVLMVLVSAMLVSALYAGFVGFLKARLGIHEVITSIMLNWIALYFSNWICGLDFFHKPGTIGMYPVNDCTYTMILPAWKKTEAGQAFLASHPLLQETLGRTDLNIGFIVAVPLKQHEKRLRTSCGGPKHSRRPLRRYQRQQKHRARDDDFRRALRTRRRLLCDRPVPAHCFDALCL